MSEPGEPAIDWGSVFSDAHRRVALRLAVLAAVGGVGAILLLGGGVATRAAVQNDGSAPPPPPHVTGPDLTIASIESGTIRVENAGDADAGPFEVLARTEEEEVSVEPADSDGLAVGGSAEFELECGEGLPLVTVEVRNAETAETVDERSEEGPCEGGVDLADLTISVEGETAVIVNSGSGPAVELSVSATDSEGSPVPVGISSISELAPGDSEPVTLECEEGSTVTVTVESLEGDAAVGTGTCGEAPQGPGEDGTGDEPEGSASGIDPDEESAEASP